MRAGDNDSGVDIINEIVADEDEILIFQQDGIPLHCANVCRNSLVVGLDELDGNLTTMLSPTLHRWTFIYSERVRNIECLRQRIQ